MVVDVTAMRPLQPELIPDVEPWFDDREVRARLGGRPWIARELKLIESQPSTTFRGRVVTARYGWVAYRDAQPLGYLGAEIYDAAAAEIVLVVDPASRSRGDGRRIIAAALHQPELMGLPRMQGHVADDNVAAIRCAQAAGFAVDPDDQFGDPHEIAFARLL